MVPYYKHSIMLPILISLLCIDAIYAGRSRSLINARASISQLKAKSLIVSLSNSNKHVVELLPNEGQVSSSSLLVIRGGGNGGVGGKKQVKKKRTRTRGSLKKRKKMKKKNKHEDHVDEDDEAEGDGDTVKSGKSIIKQALKEDPAIAMGDAIRARAPDLLQDDLSTSFHHNDMTFHSISYALGSSEQQSLQSQKRLANQKQKQQLQNANKNQFNQRIPSTSSLQDGGGVQPSTSAVIANYFLKSHGGLHGIQSIMSFLSVIFGISSFAVNVNSNNNTNNIPQQLLSLKIRLIQRTLLCALAKHISGFIAAATASARRIPDIGWRETRMRMDRFALDPVSQYLFYCALLVLWTNGVAGTFGTGDVSSVGKVAKAAISATTTTATATAAIPWWLKGSQNFYCTLCLIGPILVREIISTIWVIADVLVLQLSSNLDPSSSLSSSNENRKTQSVILKTGTIIIDSVMSLLLTPQQWRDADAATKQKLLAKVVSKISLGMEIGTGLILTYDAIRAIIDFSISPVSTRPSIVAVAKRILCARLYINFMLVRRKKVVDLVNGIRGGFVHVPTRVLDIMLEPGKAMGLNWQNGSDDDERRPKSGIEWLGYLAGL